MKKVRKTTEDYVKNIYLISQKDEVHACKVAEQMGCTKPTVSVALKRLAKEEYLTIDGDNVIRLTEKGLEMAQSVYHRHQILQTFLMGLGVREDTAARDACEMEHGLSEESYEALKDYILAHIPEKPGEQENP